MVPQDHAAKEKALQTMSSMSSAQIVSATAIHNKAAAAGLASLGLASPVSYPGAVSSTPPPLSANHHYPCFKLSHLLSRILFYFISIHSSLSCYQYNDVNGIIYFQNGMINDFFLKQKFYNNKKK